ncbi:MAG: glucose-1-phosphate thymidylyltransferase, partial [Bacteroidetes bacterium]|nr:glucose-1-phosphate thymidylyltransferase [Bacteroidota bacterium]
MNIILFDDPQIRQSLLPLTFTRPVAALRIGILTIAEKWEKYSNRVSFLTEKYLQKKFPLKPAQENILINAAVCPDEKLFNSINNLKQGHSLVKNDLIIAIKLHSKELSDIKSIDDCNEIFILQTNKSEKYERDLVIIKELWDIF